jgi:hypothetical protein
MQDKATKHMENYFISGYSTALEKILLDSPVIHTKTKKDN